jgi:serine/threonine protein phosphatase PrpC
MSNQISQVSSNEEIDPSVNTEINIEPNPDITSEVNTEIIPNIHIPESPKSELNWIEYTAVCDKGKVREANEDAYLVEPWQNQDGSEALLVVVADGMGGHRGGKEAADIAIKTFKELLNQPFLTDKEKLFELLVRYFHKADENIREQACQSFKLMDMGTTIVLAVFTPDFYIYLHAGDCRFYHIRKDEPIRISQDHSVVQVLIELGKITEKDVATHPMRSVVNSSLGGRNATGTFTVSPQWNEETPPIYPYEAGDIFLLCSDGLHGEVTKEKILEIAQNHSEAPELITQTLLDTALENGGKDNITVVAVRGVKKDIVLSSS